MSTKKSYIKSKLDKRLKRLDIVSRFLILFMLAIVLYDSFIHHTPLYYYLFFVAGLYFGKLFKIGMQVQHNSETNTIELRKSLFYILLTLVLFVVRHFVGKTLLESFHVIWATDALYLFFIGIYRAKWQGILNQIDEMIYKYISNSNRQQ